MTFCDGGDGGNFIPANQPTIQLFRFKIITELCFVWFVGFEGSQYQFQTESTSFVLHES